ncbi:MAG TPA: hypothetical protein VGQ55_00205, partial [Pyrinomonadaceae bacterium]|nr:hypothetical protein [Pyrinomonadaceae bacterium]
MIRMLVLLLTAMTLSMAASAQGKLPKFNAYPATVEKARAKKIDFRRSPGAGSFRTRLSESLREGTDFAGHYKIAGWGCGTGCISGAVIDMRNGRVYFPEEFYALSVGYFSGDYESEPLKYKVNSRLLIISGIPGRADNKPDQ